MTYFLDFDRTLFDTDAFIEHLALRADVQALGALPEEPLSHALERMTVQKTLTFAPGDLKQFVYGDVPEAMRAFGNEAIILTYDNPAFQKLKIENSLEGIPRVSAIYTGLVRKGIFMKERMAGYRDPLLVDDRALELEIMEKECPQVRLFEMRRDGQPGDGRWPVIRSLNELP